MGAFFSCLSTEDDHIRMSSSSQGPMPIVSIRSFNSKYTEDKSLENDLSMRSRIDKDLAPLEVKLDSSMIIFPSSNTVYSGPHMKDSVGSVGDVWFSKKSPASPRYRFTTDAMMEYVMSTGKFSLPRSVANSSCTSSYFQLPMTQVLSNLYIGTYDDACNENELKRKGITHILSVFAHTSSIKGVEYKKYPMDDSGKTNLKAVLDEVSEFMEMGQKANNSLLVHCQSGQNRSPVVIISWLMTKRNKTLHDAHSKVKKLRPIVHINLHYARKLLELEQELSNGIHTLPMSWMEREYDELAGEVFYKHDNLISSRKRLVFL